MCTRIDVCALADALLSLQSPERAFDSQLVSKLCCFQMLEVLFSRLPKEVLCTKTSKVTAAYCRAKVETGKELAKALTV